MNPRFLLLIGTICLLNFAVQAQDSCAVDGGYLTFENQDTVFSICVGDTTDTSFEVLLEGMLGDTQAWVLTDPTGIILDIPAGPPFTIGGNGEATCYLWNISYQDTLDGLVVGAQADSISGCFDLSNALTIIKSESLQGGSLMSRDSTLTVEFCAGSEDSRAVEVILSNANGPFSAWLITDSAFNILAVPEGPPFDFSSIEQTACQLWHVSHEVGVDGLEAGANVGDIQGCFELSNLLSIIKSELEPPSIYVRDTIQEMSFCPGDSGSMNIDVMLEPGGGNQSAWLITDSAGVILSIPLAPPFDVSDSTASICRIYNVTYMDSLSGLAIGNRLEDLVGCHSLSEPVTIYKNGVDGGRIYLPGDETEALICLNDNLTELKFASVAGAIGSNSAWLITNTDGYILETPEAPPFSFEDESADTCLIWHMSYEGTVGNFTPGSHTDNLTGCYDLSNLIAIIKAEAIAGSIWLRDSTRYTEFCAINRDTSFVDLLWEAGDGEHQAWVITDEEGIILEMPELPPFEINKPGKGLRHIYLMTYNGTLEGFDLGHSIEDIEGCYSLSEPVVVNPNGGAEAGFIYTRDTLTEVTICIDDSYSDEVDVSVSNASSLSEKWLIVDEEGVILEIPLSPPFSFAGAGPGTCFIYYLQYTDSLDGVEMGGQINEISGCFDLSNGIRVDRKVNNCGSDQFMEYGVMNNVGSGWVTVQLEHEYRSMVVVATPLINNIFTKPVVTRIRNAVGNSFELRVQVPGAENAPANYEVQYVVVEEGVYKEELDGVKMEAVRWNSERTSQKGDWRLERRDYSNNYINPVVLGQVMSYNDERWSVFWSSNGRRKILPPGSFSISATKHVGEDTDVLRNDEMIGVLIIEEGLYDLENISFVAGITPKAIRGVEETNLGFVQETELDEIQGGVLSAFGMRGSNFGWPVYFGEQPFDGDKFHLAIDEDQINDVERRHPKEEVAYLLIGQGSAVPDISPDAPQITSYSGEERTVMDLKVFPNPANARFTIEINAPSNEVAVLRVLDIRGQVVSQWSTRVQKGMNRIEPDQHQLQNGIYSIMVVTESGLTAQKKISIIQ